MRDAFPLPPNQDGLARTGITCQCCGRVTVLSVQGLFQTSARGSAQRFCDPACRQAVFCVLGVLFIDVGISLDVVEGAHALVGQLRMTAATKSKHDHLDRHVPMGEADRRTCTPRTSRSPT